MAKESLREALHPRHLPMLVQPKRWISYNDGGYLYNKGELWILFLWCGVCVWWLGGLLVCYNVRVARGVMYVL